jgi:hypothetical protein
MISSIENLFNFWLIWYMVSFFLILFLGIILYDIIISCLETCFTCITYLNFLWNDILFLDKVDTHSFYEWIYIEWCCNIDSYHQSTESFIFILYSHFQVGKFISHSILSGVLRIGVRKFISHSILSDVLRIFTYSNLSYIDNFTF